MPRVQGEFRQSWATPTVVFAAVVLISFLADVFPHGTQATIYEMLIVGSDKIILRASKLTPSSIPTAGSCVWSSDAFAKLYSAKELAIVVGEMGS